MNTLQMTLGFDGPVLTAGVGAHRVGLDAEMRRDSAGRTMIPGSHVRGRIREALEELLLMADPTNDFDHSTTAHDASAWIFGRPQARTEPKLTSLLQVDDLILGEPRAAGSTEAIAQSNDSESLVALQKRNYRVDASQLQPHEASYRVAIDARTGSSREGALAFQEGERLGAKRFFSGELRVVIQQTDLASGLTPDEIMNIIACSAAWMRYIGKQNTAGWGLITSRAIEPAPRVEELRQQLHKLWKAADSISTPNTPRTRSAYAPSDGLASIHIAIVLHGPLLVADGTPGLNVFEGRTDIPGSVLRRAMADVILENAGLRRGGWLKDSYENLSPKDQEVAKSFDSIRASFAFPVSAEEPGEAHLQAPLPASLFAFKDSLRTLDDDFSDLEATSWSDAIGILPDGLESAVDHILHDREVSPVFISSDPSAWLGQSKNLRTMQTHVAKSRRTGAALDGQLFSSRPLAAFRRDEQGRAIDERTRLVATVQCPADLVNDVKRILARVRHLGKAVGSGYGAVRIYSVDQPQDHWQKRLKPLWDRTRNHGYLDVPLVLRTETLLLNGWELDLGQCLINPYTEAWQDVLHETGYPNAKNLQCPVVLATHRLWGGATAMGRGAIPPVLMTRAGSTFVLRFPATDEKQVQKAIDRLARAGVQRASLLSEIDRTWNRVAPFGCDNGYGEIRIAHGRHSISSSGR